MKKFLKILVFLIILGAVGVYLERSGYVYHNDIIAKVLHYNVEGLDVSHHQIKINWKNDVVRPSKISAVSPTLSIK